MASMRTSARVIKALGIPLAVTISLAAQSPMLMAQPSFCTSNCDDGCGGTANCDESCGGESQSGCQCRQTCDACLWHREHMLGDWSGIRPALAEHGIVFNASLTQFFQGVASGASEQTFRYGDKFDLYMNADTGKLGLWEGGKLAVHAVDWQFGQNSIGDAAGLAPVNLQMLTPRIEPSFGLTELFYVHELGAGWELGVGRVNMLDLWTDFYPDVTGRFKQGH